MKIIAIGDIHGRTEWKQIVQNNTFDKCVFIGDYFDTHQNISPEQQKQNFEDLIQFKKNNFDKVILLIGNHDHHYCKNVHETYSGFQKFHKIDIQELLENALKENLLQMCYRHNRYLFTHAGVTKTWLLNNNYTPDQNVDEFVNNLYKENISAFGFTEGRNFSPYGDDVCQTPIWVRPNSLEKDTVDNHIQIVGHTAQNEIKFIGDDNIVLIDTLGTSKQFLEIDNDIFKVQTIV